MSPYDTDFIKIKQDEFKINAKPFYEILDDFCNTCQDRDCLNLSEEQENNFDYGKCQKNKYFQYLGEQKYAEKKARQALVNGNMPKKTSKCQVCGNSGDLVLHHYNGYQNCFDTWWICRSCNSILKHREYASACTIQDARKIVISKRFKRVEHWLRWRDKQSFWCDVCDSEGLGSEMYFIENIPFVETLALCTYCAGSMGLYDQRS